MLSGCNKKKKKKRSQTLTFPCKVLEPHLSQLAESQRAKGKVKGDTCLMPTGVAPIPSFNLAVSELAAGKCVRGSLNS